MPSITAMPKIEMNPTAAETLNGVPVRYRPRIPPMQATGICAMMTKVSMSDVVAA